MAKLHVTIRYKYERYIFIKIKLLFKIMGFPLWEASIHMTNNLPYVLSQSKNLKQLSCSAT